MGAWAGKPGLYSAWLPSIPLERSESIKRAQISTKTKLSTLDMDLTARKGIYYG
jgi:hypothetical protein